MNHVHARTCRRLADLLETAEENERDCGGTRVIHFKLAMRLSQEFRAHLEEIADRLDPEPVAWDGGLPPLSMRGEG